MRQFAERIFFFLPFPPRESLTRDKNTHSHARAQLTRERSLPFRVIYSCVTSHFTLSASRVSRRSRANLKNASSKKNKTTFACDVAGWRRRLVWKRYEG